MQFYIVSPATNTTETGSEYPQVQKMAPEYNYQAKNSVYAVSKTLDKIPDYKPNLDYFIVSEKAKLTDILSVSTIHGGFLISPSYKKILENFNLPLHKFFNANVFYKQKFFKYYWLHIICDLTNNVDYSNSEFIAFYNYKHDLGTIKISTKEDFLQKKIELKNNNPGKTITIWAKKIAFKKVFNSNLDLFKIGMFDSNFYITGKLKEKIYSEKITGCSILPATNLFNSQ